MLWYSYIVFSLSVVENQTEQALFEITGCHRMTLPWSSRCDIQARGPSVSNHLQCTNAHMLSKATVNNTETIVLANFFLLILAYFIYSAIFKSGSLPRKEQAQCGSIARKKLWHPVGCSRTLHSMFAYNVQFWMRHLCAAANVLQCHERPRPRTWRWRAELPTTAAQLLCALLQLVRLQAQNQNKSKCCEPHHEQTESAAFRKDVPAKLHVIERHLLSQASVWRNCDGNCFNCFSLGKM